jgi:hypothetical protein
MTQEWSSSNNLSFHEHWLNWYLAILIFLKDSITVSIKVTMAKQRCSKE